MATWKILRFRTDRDLYDTLNGAINSKKDIADGLPLDGLTLIIDVGGAGNRTVNFAPALNRLWTPEEIVAQIVAAHGDLTGAAKLNREPAGRAGMNPTYLRIGKDDGSVVTVRATGTANALFGFATGASPANDTVGVPYADTEVMSRVGMSDQSWYAVTYK